MLEHWVGSVAVNDDALQFKGPLLPVYFRSFGGTRDSGKLYCIRWERMARSRTGFFVPYPSVAINVRSYQSRMTRYVNLSS